MGKEVVQVGFKVDKFDWQKCSEKGSVSKSIISLLEDKDSLSNALHVDMSAVDHDPLIVLRTIRVPKVLANEIALFGQRHDLSQSQLLRRLIRMIAEV